MTIITLLTDFGSTTPYPAEVKGVLLTLCHATIVDITHDVPPRDIAWGAHLLAAAAPAFPAGTIHLAVVDPGVGTARHPLAVVSGGQFFIGPDNGLLMPAARAIGESRGYVIDADRFARRPASATFHGRDLFAPAAAALAAGLSIEAIGAPAAILVDLAERVPVRESRTLTGQVGYRDSFGNLVTNIPGSWLDQAAGLLTLKSTRGRLSLRRARTFADGARGELLVLAGSGGTVEIAINGGDAAETTGLSPGDPVTLHVRPSSRRGAGTRPPVRK